MLGLHFTRACVLLLVCSLHFTLSLHFTPGPQSAVCSLQSAVCVLHWPFVQECFLCFQSLELMKYQIFSTFKSNSNASLHAEVTPLSRCDFKELTEIRKFNDLGILKCYYFYTQASRAGSWLSLHSIAHQFNLVTPWGCAQMTRGVLLGILGGGVPPGCSNPDSISDQEM